jgi:hypothetical protein
MLPDQGCYEERYRLTFPVARSAAFSLVALIPAIVSHQPLPWLVLCPLVFALATVPWVLAAAGCKIAFRADMTGITNCHTDRTRRLRASLIDPYLKGTVTGPGRGW